MEERKKVLNYKIDVTDYLNVEKCQTLDGFLEHVTNNVALLKEMHLKEGIVDHKLTVEYYGYYYDDGGFDIILHVYRLENDEEYNKRLIKKRKAEDKKLAKQAEKDAKEKDEYERLKAKYG